MSDVYIFLILAKKVTEKIFNFFKMIHVCLSDKHEARMQILVVIKKMR